MTRSTRPSKKTLQRVLDRDEGNCLRCGQTAQDVQHRVSRGAGGTRRADINNLSNLVSMCRRCHHWAESAERELAYLTGWAIRRGETDTPDMVPLYDLAGRCIQLTDDGARKYLSPDNFFPSDPAAHVAPF